MCRNYFSGESKKRDFVYIEDVVQANLKALEAKKSGVYNVGGGVARQFNELFGALTTTLGIEKAIEYIDNPYKFYQNHTEADISLSREFLGYEPRFSLEDGIKAYADEIKVIAKREFGA